MDGSNGPNTTATVILGAGEHNPTLDAGFYPEPEEEPASLGDYVWLDEDQDGVQDANEDGLNGVEVTLYDGNGNVVETVFTTTNPTTGEDGYYHFDDLTPGQPYYVGFGTPNGYEPTASNQGGNDSADSDMDGSNGPNTTPTVVLGSGEYNPTLDAGFYPTTGSIGDYVWADTDGDGIQDPDEQGIPGVEVTLFYPDGSTLTTITGPNGEYEFTDLPPDFYFVEITDAPEGMISTTNDFIFVPLDAGDNYPDADFGFQPLGSIGDTVWYDADGDGIQDPDEPGIRNVTVSLTLPNGQVITTVTDNEGNYTFPNLPAGNYTVTVGQGPDGTNITTPNTFNVNLGSAEDYVDADFGFQPDSQLGIIGDFVWFDLDGDGQQDDDEPGIAGIDVTITGLGGFTETVTTDANGMYIFDELPQGNYTITVGQGPDGTSLTTPGSTITNLNEGEIELDIDFGFEPEDRLLGNIGDFVWFDIDMDGVQDLSEVGIGGVSVILYDASGRPIRTVITDQFGYYLFEDLPPGDYSISIDPLTVPLGLVGTTSNPIEYTLPVGENYPDADFGFGPLGGGLPFEYCTDNFANVELCVDLNTGEVLDRIATQHDSNVAQTSTECLTYYPDSQFSGTEIITVEVCQANNINDCRIESFVVNVGCVVPTVNNDYASINPTSITVNGQTTPDADGSAYEDGVFIGTRDNDYDMCYDITSFTTLVGPSNGTGAVNPSTGIVHYTPNSGFEGQDVITYQACNGCGSCNTATVIIDVTQPTTGGDNNGGDNNGGDNNGGDNNGGDNNGGDNNGGNNGPCNYAEVIYECTGQLQPLNICPEFCLEGNYEISTVHTTYNCSLKIDDDCITYTPLPAFTGEETIEITACNDAGICKTVQAKVTVGECEECTPHGEDICTEPLETSSICPDFCFQGDYSITAAHTTFECGLTILDQCVKYTALPGSAGMTDQIEITACQGNKCETVVIDIAVSNCDENAPPVAQDDSGVAEDGEPVGINPMTNDSDPENDELEITSFTQPQHGTVEYVNGEFVYTPDPGYEGPDQFTYQLCDEHGRCDDAVVTLEVQAAPCEEVLYYCAQPIQAIDICPNFCELGGNEDIVITDAHTTYNCSLKLLDGGKCISYTALPLFAGEETINITACNSTGQCQTLEIKVQVKDCEDDGTGKQQGSIAPNTNEILELAISEVSPVPATNYLNLSFTSGQGKAEIEIRDLAGKVMMTQEVDAFKGLNLRRLDVENYTSGIYVITIRTNDNVTSTKFVKQ